MQSLPLVKAGPGIEPTISGPPHKYAISLLDQGLILDLRNAKLIIDQYIVQPKLKIVELKVTIFLFSESENQPPCVEKLDGVSSERLITAGAVFVGERKQPKQKQSSPVFIT